MQDIKKNGVIHTPNILGQYMSKLLLSISKKYGINIDSILDPSLGDGDLLLSSTKFFPGSTYYGMDIDYSSIKEAEKRFKQHKINDFKFTTEDYLISQPNLLNNNNKKRKNVDAIIANPPYVRTQNIQNNIHKLENNYNIKGRMDLYQAFIVEMTQQLSDGGILCMITPNRYLSTESGKSTRRFLRNNYHIINVIDLGDTKVFNSSVLPAIFIGIKDSKFNNKIVNFKKIYEAKTQISDDNPKYYNIFEALENNYLHTKIFSIIDNKTYNLESGEMILPESISAPWTLSSVEKISWANNLIENNKKFSDIFDVHVGIKTTADRVFIRKDWSSQINYNENELLHPLIASKNISRWTSDNITNERTILYPYKIVNNKRKVIDLDNYPLTQKYLHSFKQRLMKRTYLIRSGRKWYEIWVPQNPILMKKPKVVFPDISNTPKFTLDMNGYMVDGNCYWLSLKKGMDINYLYLSVILSNSLIFQKFHDIKFQNKLYSGKNRYLTQYVSKYPIPDIHKRESQQLIKICKKIISSNNSDKLFLSMSNKIDNLIKNSLSN